MAALTAVIVLIARDVYDVREVIKVGSRYIATRSLLAFNVWKFSLPTENRKYDL
jgi:hypothetical protein